MSNFDLGNAADFSQITGGALTDVGKAFGFNPSDWDIREGSYNGVLFHVFKSKADWNGALSRISDIGGRRKVKYQFPYLDGQTTDDLGRKPGHFDLDVLIFGKNYLKCLNALEAEFNKPTPGELVHPVRGKITCAVEDVEITHQSDQRKACALRITFIEHNFTVGSITQLTDSTLKGALSAALAVFAQVDRAINEVDGALLLARGIKNLIKSLLSSYKKASATTLTNINVSFNKKGGSSDIPALLPVNLGGTGKATSTTGGTTTAVGTGGSSAQTGSSTVASTQNFVTVRSISDPFNGIPVADLSPSAAQALAVPQVTKQVQDLRDQLATILQAIEASPAALELFDTAISLRQTAVLIQTALERGVAQSNAHITDFTVPRVMSIREVCWANGLSPERSEDVDILNPDLESVNMIAPGTVVKVPIA
jgi:prophage DNA circulation protein